VLKYKSSFVHENQRTLKEIKNKIFPNFTFVSSSKKYFNCRHNLIQSSPGQFKTPESGHIVFFLKFDKKGKSFQSLIYRKNFQEIRAYFPEVFRKIGAYFPEVVRKIGAYFPEVVKMAMLQKRHMRPQPKGGADATQYKLFSIALSKAWAQPVQRSCIN
jgi:hypothetical protein